jgi:proteasome lid subunit RPN8/RPN11
MKKEFVILQKVFEDIKNSIGKKSAETGGLLFGSRKEMIVTDFIFDDANTTRVTYTFDADYLNQQIKDKWEQEGKEVIGFVHSHPHGNTEPSGPDLKVFAKYIRRFKGCNYLYTPIVNSDKDGGFSFHPYIYTVNDNSYRAQRIIELVPTYSLLEGGITYLQRDLDYFGNEIEEECAMNYERIEDAVDIDLVQNTNVTIVGAGGAFSLYENLVRSGVQNIVAIDYDVVESTNIVRQGYFQHSIGQLKVEALSDHLLEINPNLNFKSVKKDVTKLTHKEYEECFGNSDLLVFVTDSFEAQAFGNRLALKYNKPAVWAGYYTKSRCAEIIFSIPEVTKACFRCIASSRYEAQKIKKVKLSSSCNTAFHSSFLDSIIGMLILAILHNDSKKSVEYAGWFGKSWSKNLIQIKTHPKYEGIFSAKYNKMGGLVNFTAIWQDVEPERPPKYEHCPDCLELSESE